MKLYNQRIYPQLLGYGPTHIFTHGCKLTCFSMITEIDPVTLNSKFKKDWAFINDLLPDEAVAKSLGIEFEGKVTKDPKKICLAEVDMSPAPEKQQHFVVWMADGTIWDPWTGTVRPANTYPIINYRVFNFDKYLSDMKPTKDLAREYKALTGEDCGPNMNDNEQDDFAKEIKKLRETPTPPAQNCDVYIEKVKDLEEENRVLHARITELEPKADIGNRFQELVSMAK
jgi:hypothetical protein